MKFLLLTFLFSLPALALETDNYIVWGQELQDSSEHINTFFTEGIETALAAIPDHEQKSCEEMTRIISKDFASYLVHDNPVENWLFKVLTSAEMYPGDMNYVKGSIYREPFRFYIPWFGLAPNIQVNGFYFGTDKLSHFASTGMIYFKIFQRELALGHSEIDAMKSAINWGIQDEKSLHGYWASGVLSYADLESNFQGLRFYREFCDGKEPFLKRNPDGRWILSKTPAIENYVSGLWDESYELSYRLPENWEHVKKELKRYCLDSRTPEVRARFAYYKHSPESMSKKYLETLKKAELLPDPEVSQSFVDICR
jgi:hypothetical protein